LSKFGVPILSALRFFVMNSNSKRIMPQALAQNHSGGMQTGGSNSTSSIKATNHANIVLVHDLWADGSSWIKVIPILEKAGHKVIAVQLALHSLEDDSYW